MNKIDNQPKHIWEPSELRIKEANLTRFISYVNSKKSLSLRNYDELYQWSVDSLQDFWSLAWDFFEIQASKNPDCVVSDLDNMLQARWFPGSKLNFAENLLRKCNDKDCKSKEAIVFLSETGLRKATSYHELLEMVAKLALYFKELGVKPGDRVCAFTPNLPETVVAMLATTSIGAIWSSCSPDFGFNGVMDRFGQIKPKLLLCADGYFYKGKKFDSLTTVSKLTDSISQIENVIVIPYLEDNPDLSALDNASLFEDCLKQSTAVDNTAVDISFEQLPFDHPIYILYSSGTTGVPKCIVHRSGGVLLEHLKELVLHSDLKQHDRIFYHTTCGWMMWNWLVSSLAVGATIYLYDGFPFYPENSALIDIAEKEKISIFGTSARYLAAIEKLELKPIETHDLSELKTILSTGSPLAPTSFDYVYSSVKKDVLLASIAGGTDLVGCFAAGNPIGPVYKGELQARCLAKKVEVYDSTGKSVRGEKGELVCTAPFPSMPLKFWNDEGDKKYLAAYFESYPGVWHHGDFVELTENDGIIMYGRSDAILNPAGVRIGTAEIYRQVEKIPEVLEALATAQEWQGDQRIILFVTLKNQVGLDDDLQTRIKKQITKGASPRHVPAKIIAVPDIPRTISGKIVELAVREIIHGREVLNKDALANPEALEHFKALEALKV